MIVDTHLIRNVQRQATGANIHQINNAVLGYQLNATYDCPLAALNAWHRLRRLVTGMKGVCMHYYIQVWPSKDGWRFRIKAKNGRIILSSEAYSRKDKALQSAQRLAAATGLEVTQ